MSFNPDLPITAEPPASYALWRPSRRVRLVAIQLSNPVQPKTKSGRTTPHKAAFAPHVEPLHVPHPPVKVPPVPAFAIIKLSHEEFAATDISKLGKHAADTGGAGPKTFGPSEGPGGTELVNAEWYREPTNAEISGYLPHGAPPGAHATIACRMIEHYHVENCQPLSETPPGSGLARALRQASWQFLVRPPRRDGVAMVGTWVRIRFDFTGPGKKDDEGSAAGDDAQ